MDKISEIGYRWVPGTEKISEVGYRREFLPARQKILGTDGYWVPAKFSSMPDKF